MRWEAAVTDADDIKRKLRELKRLEIKLRVGLVTAVPRQLVWDVFFDLHENGSGKAKYPLEKLVQMTRDEYKNAVNEYWTFLYNELFDIGGIHKNINRDAELLAKIGLPYEADINAVKKRFRELAKIYHPDTGGDAEKFIELMETYKKLTGR